MNQDARIFVAGGETLLGAAILEALAASGFRNLIRFAASAVDLANGPAVEAFFDAERPEFVFLAAGKSGGIGLNRAQPADLMLDNLLSSANVISAAHRHGVKKLLYLASSCVYPRKALQPMRIEALGTGPMEETSEAYSTAKLAGWKLCDAYRRQFGCRFITAIPANAFGPHDDFAPETGHVIPSLIRRAHDAKEKGDRELVVWGSGTPRREFVYSRDIASACVFAMRNYDREAPINLGGGVDVSIAEAARVVAEVVGFRGRLVFDQSKPDGAPLKALDSSPLLAMGWRPATDFRTAIAETYRWFLANGRHDAVCAACSSASRRTESNRNSRLYRSLYRIRRVEEEVARTYPTDKIKSPVHLSIGQEAVSVGVCQALGSTDVVFGTYRGHAMYLAKGGNLNAMIAELFGKRTGCTRGKGGSMHLIDPDAGVMGTSAVVGTTIGNAAGYAYAMKLRKSKAVVVSFFGDGATEEGVFAETLNFAVLKKLPVLFVCENNGYAIHTHQNCRQGRPDIRAKAEAFGVPSDRLDGNDVLGLFRRTAEVIEKLRRGEGPWLFEVSTYRWKEHVGPGGDYQLG
ncbi:MAG TPA: thiamine pyrophosphate-dependent enzyme, partial [Gemmata sp.]|nr:thiamine pyrophosphate-dependent enzyme [Gemmata sp.]